jgi:hypothetical protein
MIAFLVVSAIAGFVLACCGAIGVGEPIPAPVPKRVDARIVRGVWTVDQ